MPPFSSCATEVCPGPCGLASLCQPYGWPYPLLSERFKHSQVSKCPGPSRTYWPFSLERPLSFQLTLHLFPMPCLQTVQTREMYRAKPCRLWCWISCRNRPTRTFSKLQSVAKAPWTPANSGPQQWEWCDGTERGLSDPPARRQVSTQWGVAQAWRGGLKTSSGLRLGGDTGIFALLVHFKVYLFFFFCYIRNSKEKKIKTKKKNALACCLPVFSQ